MTHMSITNFNFTQLSFKVEFLSVSVFLIVYGCFGQTSWERTTLPGISENFANSLQFSMQDIYLNIYFIWKTSCDHVTVSDEKYSKTIKKTYWCNI